MYMSVDLTFIGSDNGLLSICHQAITWNNDGMLSIRPWGTHFNEIFKIQKFFTQENAFENIICETAAILSLPQCVKMKELYIVYWLAFWSFKECFWWAYPGLQIWTYAMLVLF